MVITPMNAVGLALLGLILCAIVGLYLALHKKPQMYRRDVLLALCLINAVYLLLYKAYILWIDPTYHTGFWYELPLQLCNAITYLLIIGIALGSRAVLLFCFYCGVLSAPLTILMPDERFVGNSIFLLRNIGYYGTHAMLMISVVSLVTLGVYEPRYRDVPKALASLLLYGSVTFLFNLWLRNTVAPNANYCYLFQPNGSAVLEALYSLTQGPYTYLFPVLLPGGMAMYLITALYRLCAKAKRTA
ncbi:MAG: YwaF family protein [Oscillospiraceae bacterium]|nr:YwaF family protein [Oscillospiraceae bacterium]